MGRFVTIDGGPTGPALHVADPSVPLDALVVDPRDVWRTQPEVRKVVDFVARNLASVPLHVYGRDGKDGRARVRDGLAATLLASPAPLTTPYRFWHTWHVDVLLFDRAAAVYLPDEGTDPAMLFRLPPSRFRIKRDEYGTPVKLIVWPKDGSEYHLDPQLAIFDTGYATAWNDVTPPIDALAQVLGESDDARRYRRDLLRNGARVSAVIERPVDAPSWDDAAWNRFKSQFAAYKAGGGDAGGTPLLEDGMTYKPVNAHSPDTVEVLEARKLTAAEVAAFYHVPPEMVGAREGTYANVDAFRQMLWSISLGPAISAWEQAVNDGLHRIAAMPPTQYVEAHVDAKLRGSFLEQSQATQSAVGAPILTRNEARRMRNLPAIEGGDELITPLNVLVGGLASPRDTGPGSGGGGGGATVTPPASEPADKTTTPSGYTPDEVAKLVTAASALIRSGFDPEAALAAVGLDPIDHLGLLPVTVQKPTVPENVDTALVDEVAKALVAASIVRKAVAARTVRGRVGGV